MHCSFAARRAPPIYGEGVTVLFFWLRGDQSEHLLLTPLSMLTLDTSSWELAVTERFPRANLVHPSIQQFD